MNEPVDFEIAIESTGFGLFNIMLLLIAIPSCLATVFESSTMSYVLPSAECDLKLNLLDKGMLNGITYAGMILSAIPWGFLADTKGRKNVLVLGYSIDFVCVLGSALSQNLTSIMIFKFLGGFAICGPFAVVMAYMSEFHGIKYRSRVMMIIGMLFSIGNLVLPALAWLILPNNWNFSYFDNFLVVHSWQVFLGVCSFPSFICAAIYPLFPESPKFLMAEGRNEEALNILSKVYSINCRKSKINYPISKLIEEVPQRNKKEDKTEQHTVKCNLSRSFLKRGHKQLKPLLFKPYVGYSFHIYAVQFCILLGLNTIRLWLPQLFTSIEEFKSSDHGQNGLCAILEHSVNKTKIINLESLTSCKIEIDETAYINTMIIGLAGLIGYFVAGGLINNVGNKNILIIGLSICSLSGFSLYWANDSFTTLIISSIYVTVGSIGATSLIGIVVNLFPTSLRTMTISIAMMFGRLGALIGNILFPFFMSLGCLPPFFMIGFIMLIAVILGCILPPTHKAALK